ncbi:hypothetical protein JXJ21_08300 [candidate division KSB1 bacterium]|nr:hypothetical protein [candidate division KSB1 bacterium]
MKGHTRASLAVGILLIAIGSLLLIHNLMDLYLGRSYFIPLMIMAVGALFFASIRSREKSGAALPGTFFLLGGAAILAMNYPPIYEVMSNIYPWTFVILLLGLSFFVLFLIKPGDTGLLIPASVLIVLGALFTLHDLWILDWDNINRLWPLIPIAIGVGIIVRAILKKPMQTE